MTSNISIDADSVDEAVIIMTRMFDAPRDKVWECFTRPEHVARWFGGVGYTTEILEMDVRPGGLFRLVMNTPEGHRFPIDNVYVEVTKPSRLVWENVGHSDGSAPNPGPPTVRQTITLEDHGQQTRWRLVGSFKSLADRDMSRNFGFAEMISQGCERFNELVKTL